MGQRNPDQFELDLRVKTCRDCNQEVPAWNFYRNQRRKDGLTTYCAPCMIAKKRRWARSEAGRLKCRARHKAWRAANSDQERRRSRDWAAANPEKNRAAQRAWYRANAKAENEANKAWRKAHPDTVRAYGILRQARLAAATTIPFTPQQLSERWAYYGNNCWICGARATATDHVKPLAKGGAHMLCNLRPICQPCNSVKSARWPYTKVDR